MINAGMSQAGGSSSAHLRDRSLVNWDEFVRS